MSFKDGRRDVEFHHDIAERKDPKRVSFFRTGTNFNVSTTEDIWGVGGLQVFPSAAAVVSIVSNDAGDTSAGSGAQSVLIIGLDANYNQITETVATSGAGAVTTTASFLRVTHMKTATAGATGSNEGTIVASISGNAQLEMLPNTNLSHNANYTVPAGYSLIITNLHFLCEEARDFDVGVFTQRPGELMMERLDFVVSPPGINLDFKPALMFPEKTTIVVRATKLAGSAGAISALGQGYLTNDTEVNTSGHSSTIGL